MKKLIGMFLLTIILTSCIGGDFSANLTNPFDDGTKETIVTLANGMRMNIENEVDSLLKGEKTDFGDYYLQAKLMVNDKTTGTTQFVDFPKLEVTKEKNTDVFDIPEELVYEDKENGYVWEKDASKSGLMTYIEAKNYCKKFGEMSYGQAFYIPEVEALKTILKNTPEKIDTSIFKNLNETYWTQHNFAYSFYYGDGVLVDKEIGLAYVRCVGILNTVENIQNNDITKTTLGIKTDITTIIPPENNISDTNPVNSLEESYSNRITN